MMMVPPITISVESEANSRRDAACRVSCSVPKKTGQAQSLHEESVDERDVRSHRRAVQVKTDSALFVRAIGFHPGLLQPLQYFSPRMSINISRAHPNDCVPWTNG